MPTKEVSRRTLGLVIAKEAWLSQSVEWNVWSHLAGSFTITSLLSLGFYARGIGSPLVWGAATAWVLGFLYEIWQGIPELHFAKMCPGFGPKDLAVNAMGGLTAMTVLALMGTEDVTIGTPQVLAAMASGYLVMVIFMVLGTITELSIVMARALDIHRTVQDMARRQATANQEGAGGMGPVGTGSTESRK